MSGGGGGGLNSILRFSALSGGIFVCGFQNFPVRFACQLLYLNSMRQGRRRRGGGQRGTSGF